MLKRNIISVFYCAILIISTSIFHTHVKASDHIDWPDPFNITFSELDITDFYAWVPKQGKLVLVMNLHFNADETTKFSSENIEYRFRLRPVTLDTSQSAKVVVPELVYDAPEVTVSCRVRDKIASCSAAGYSAYNRLGQVQRFHPKKPLQLFAGTIFDPFFADGAWLQKRNAESRSDFDPFADPDYIGPVALENPVNLTDGMGVLSITVALDIEHILGKRYQYYAIASDVLVDDIIFERVGRPGTNSLVIRINELKDDYNGSDPFNLSPLEVVTYTNLLAAGVEGWDKLDKKTDWTPNDKDALVKTLLLDALIINVKNKCAFEENAIFDIERSAGPLKHYAQKCGGLNPLANSFDTIVALLVAGPQALKDLYSDGVDRNRIQPVKKWPFFQLYKPDTVDNFEE